jgi:Domain of unknown function (DUF222)
MTLLEGSGQFSLIVRGGCYSTNRCSLNGKPLSKALRDAAAVTDPDALGGRRAARLVALAAEGERICAAAKAIGARRVEQCNGWKRSGHRTPADWLAATTGTTVGQAVGTLETARRLDELPDTRDAFLAGELSDTQTREVAAAAAEDPHAERDLLAAAQSQSVKELRDRSRSVIAAARADDVAHDDKIRKSRFVRAWTDTDGAGRGEWKLPPEAQARVLAQLDAETIAVADEAKRADGRFELRPPPGRASPDDRSPPDELRLAM